MGNIIFPRLCLNYYIYYITYFRLRKTHPMDFFKNDESFRTYAKERRLCTEQPCKGLYEQTEKNWRQIRVKKYRRDKKNGWRQRTNGRSEKGGSTLCRHQKKRQSENERGMRALRSVTPFRCLPPSVDRTCAIKRGEEFWRSLCTLKDHSRVKWVFFLFPFSFSQSNGGKKERKMESAAAIEGQILPCIRNGLLDICYEYST